MDNDDCNEAGCTYLLPLLLLVLSNPTFPIHNKPFILPHTLKLPLSKPSPILSQTSNYLYYSDLYL